MATSPVRPCTRAGCNSLSVGGLCSKCRSTQSITAQPRSKATDPFYSSVVWQKVRRAYRARHPLCELCSSRGRAVTATLVDHIHEISDGGDYTDSSNLMSLCRRCHSSKTARMQAARRCGNIERLVRELKQTVSG